MTYSALKDKVDIEAIKYMNMKKLNQEEIYMHIYMLR